MKQCFKCNRAFEDNSAFCPYDGQRLIFIQTNDQLVGRLIDNKYRIEEIIAKGGAGAVYRATHIQLNVPMALKIMHSNSSSDVTTLERFRREAFAAMQVRHPNAIAVMDFGVTNDGLVYVVMEYLQGVTLRHRLKEKKFFNVEESCEIIQQIAGAVAIAHKRKIVHRDLKPENIFIHMDGDTEVIKVLDFGIAKFKEAIHKIGDGNITRQGFVVGTPHYMSPEQCYGKEVDARADIYSLGIILYELLTGQMPFVGPSHTAIAVKQASEKPRPTYEVRKGVPAVVNAVVMHALEKNPKNRPPDMLSFASELEAAVKAVTEQEFLKVFLNASEQDLEAALLLANDPAKSRSVEVESDLPTLEEELDLVGALSALQAPKKTGTITRPDTATIEEAIPGSMAITVDVPSSFAPKLKNSINRDQLLVTSQEVAMLAQIIVEDLKADSPLDELFMNELRSALKNLLNNM